MHTFILKNLEDFYYEIILPWHYLCTFNKQKVNMLKQNKTKTRCLSSAHHIGIRLFVFARLLETLA